LNIFLVGYRCTGKTSVGLLLAKKTGWPFVDTDSEVASLYHMPISEIIRTHGWDSFRDVEHRVIQRTCADDRQIVATGGGAVLDPKNIEEMKRTGVTIWLKARPETIKKRLLADTGSNDLRPALTPKGTIEEVEEILFSRTRYYEAAKDFTIDTDGRGTDDVCRLILDRLAEYGLTF